MTEKPLRVQSALPVPEWVESLAGKALSFSTRRNRNSWRWIVTDRVSEARIYETN